MSTRDPAGAVAGPASGPLHTRPGSSAPSRSPRAPLKPRPGAVLVLDDDAAIVELLALLLEDEGFAVRTAHAPTQAEREVARGGIALLLLDLSALGAHPAEALARLQRAQGARRKKLPLALLSGREDLAEQARAFGAVATLRKPFALDAVVALAERYVKRGDAAA